MASRIGLARNEVIELVLGDALMFIGGFLLGYLYAEETYRNYSYIGIIIVGIGMMFDVRVLLRFSHDIKQAKADLERQENTLIHATDELNDLIRQSEKMKTELLESRGQINNARTELQGQEKALIHATEELRNVITVQETTKRELEDARRQIRDAKADLQSQQRLIEDASRTLRDVIKKVEETKKELLEAEKKTFSFMSHASRSKPVETMIENVYNELDRSLKEIERKLGMYSNRSKPF